jgi:hypothetical protein
MNNLGRWLLYIVPLFALSIAGFFVGYSVWLTNEVIFVALGVNISILLDLARKQLFRERQNFKIIKSESHIIALVNEFKEHAAAECCVIWTAIYKVPDLEAYFEQERKMLTQRKSLHIRRLIGNAHTGWTRNDLKQHVKDYSTLVASGNYSCKTTHTEGLEVIYADYKEKGNSYSRAILTLCEKDRKICYLFDEKCSHEQADMVNALKAFFESEWLAGINI